MRVTIEELQSSPSSLKAAMGWKCQRWLYFLSFT